MAFDGIAGSPACRSPDCGPARIPAIWHKEDQSPYGGDQAPGEAGIRHLPSCIQAGELFRRMYKGPPVHVIHEGPRERQREQAEQAEGACLIGVAQQEQAWVMHQRGKQHTHHN